MDCPVCRQAMKPVKIGEVQIDECRQCKGIWFDKGELAEAKDKADPDLRFFRSILVGIQKSLPR